MRVVGGGSGGWVVGDGVVGDSWLYGGCGWSYGWWGWWKVNALVVVLLMGRI